MFLRNLFLGTFLLATLLFAQSADSSTSRLQSLSNSTVTPVISVQSGSKTLKKQQAIKGTTRIKKPNTTWSKIKDLFM